MAGNTWFLNACSNLNGGTQTQLGFGLFFIISFAWFLLKWWSWEELELTGMCCNSHSLLGKQAENHPEIRPVTPGAMEQFICRGRYSSGFHKSITRGFEHHFPKAGG